MLAHADASGREALVLYSTLIQLPSKFGEGRSNSPYLRDLVARTAGHASGHSDSLGDADP